MNGLFYAASAASAGAAAYGASRQASSASRQASQARDETELVKADVEKLLMIAEALWTILKENHGYSDDELVTRVEQIDMKDGKLDGKVAKGAPLHCPTCKRTLIGTRPVCLYCGQQIFRGPFER